MKRKMLITGTNTALVKDFIQHTDSYFTGISTTDCWPDLQKHFEIFEPDGFLLLPESVNDDMVSLINKLKGSYCYHKEPIFICAPVNVCADIQKSNPRLVDLMLKRPVSADNLSLRILKYYENEEKKRQEEEKAKQIDFDEQDVPSEETETTPKKHVLIVDDDRSILKMLKAAMENEYEITTIVNGVLVPKFLQTHKVDLIILDYEMPVETGAEVLRKIRMNREYDDIPVCFLTGVAEKSKIQEILMLRPDGYLLKPVNMEALLATVSNLTM